MIFAGSGDTEKSLKKYVKTHNLEKYIKFYGNLSEDETIKWFSKLDVYLQISEDETTSTSILQAMSMNLPIIASNIGGNKKLKKKFNQSNNITLVENNEKETVVLQRRSIRLTKDLTSGTQIQLKHLEVLRPCPSDGLPPYEVKNVLGKKLCKDKSAGDHLRWIDLE